LETLIISVVYIAFKFLGLFANDIDSGIIEGIEPG